MAESFWRPTAWKLEHPELDEVVLIEQHTTRQGKLYRLDLSALGGNSASVAFEERSEGKAKARAHREALDFAEMLNGRRSSRANREKGNRR